MLWYIGTYSFVPSLTPEEMERLEVKRVPQNAGETIEMQVGCHCCGVGSGWVRWGGVSCHCSGKFIGVGGVGVVSCPLQFGNLVRAGWGATPVGWRLGCQCSGVLQCCKKTLQGLYACAAATTLPQPETL